TKMNETESNETQIKIWSQIDGNDPEKVKLHASADIDDLKEKLLGQDAKRFYRAYYKGTSLGSGEKVPLDTASHQPVVLEKFNATQAAAANSILF
ncbi:unnamed protein product, partial [Rotaria sp. Silwood1]